MLTIEEILATQKERRSKPTQEDLRKLPYENAFDLPPLIGPPVKLLIPVSLLLEQAVGI